MVSHLAYFRYIKGEGEMKEIQFHSFEVINVEMVFPVKDGTKNVEFSMASLQDALTIIKNGHPRGWGIMLEFPNNKDCVALGYNSQNLK